MKLDRSLPVLLAVIASLSAGCARKADYKPLIPEGSVHAAHLGHPIVGDTLYGDPAADRRMAVPPRRQLLHAVKLAFPHPATGKRMEFTAEPPPDLVFARAR
jgi:hypothetical protein